MNKLIRQIVQHTYKPLLVRYLTSTRFCKYRDMLIEVPPEVFHPGFFTSTKFLLHYLGRMNLAGCSFLELGAGAGLISVAAAKKQAIVTASDINPVAIQCLERNGQRNGVVLRIFYSDLFDDIPAQTFDVIAINPPFYKKEAAHKKEFAWYCGTNGEYFQKLFAQLPARMHAVSKVLMVLCDGADAAMIKGFASANGFTMTCVHEKQHLLQKNFIYQIHQQ